MNESDLAEQGAVPLASLASPEADRDAPTMAASTHETGRNTPEHFERRPDNHSVPNSDTGQSEIHSVHGKTSKVIPNEPSSPADRYIGEDDLPGWPTIASKQSRPINTGILRHFDLVKRRVMVDQQTKLWSMEKRLQELDRDDARNDPERLKKLLFDPKHLFHVDCHCDLLDPQTSPAQRPARSSSSEAPEQATQNSPPQAPNSCGTCSCTQDPKDQALEAFFQRLIKYYLFIVLSCQVEALPKVSSNSYKNFRDFVRRDLPDGEAWDALMDEKHDFITTRTNPLVKELEWLHWLLHGGPRLGFDKLFMKLFRHGDESRDEHKYIRQSFGAVLTSIAGAGVGMFCIISVAGPVGILLLMPLSDLHAFLLVVAFSVAVVLGVIVRIRDFGTAFVAFSTYTAVLVTSLSNLYQARNH